MVYFGQGCLQSWLRASKKTAKDGDPPQALTIFPLFHTLVLCSAPKPTPRCNFFETDLTANNIVIIVCHSHTHTHEYIYYSQVDGNIACCLEVIGTVTGPRSLRAKDVNLHPDWDGVFGKTCISTLPDLSYRIFVLCELTQSYINSDPKLRLENCSGVLLRL